MLRRLLLVVLVIGCRSAPTSSPTSPDAFLGRWNSVTPGREFIALMISRGSVSSFFDPSRSQGDFGARLTYSGVAWDGTGSIDGDAFRATMGPAGAATPTRVLVVRVTSPDTIRAQFGEGATADILVMVRDQ